MKLKNIEKEVVYLLVTKKLIDEMVNFEMVKLYQNDPHSEIRFNTMTHRKFFNILLVDFLSCTDNKVIGEEKPYLKCLLSICNNPSFDKNNSISALTNSVKCFKNWLNKVVIIKNIWLPSIDLEIDLSIARIEFIKICGNISKHTFTRLSSVVKEIISIFKRNNIDLNQEKALLILEEFYEWFHKDIFAYHSSAIAEFLNNIRLGIYEYLLPEYNQSIVRFKNDPIRYEYRYPEEIINTFAKECYWNLMNECRSKPYFPKFEVTKYLKMLY